MYRIEKPKLIIAILMVVIIILQIIPINSESYSKAQECAQICKTVIDENGDIWKITVAYGDDAQIPDGSELRVTEIAEGSDEYNSWYRQTIEALSEDHDDGKKSLVLSAACFFDIEIIDNKGYKIEPAAPVEVRIDHEEGFALSQNESLRVIHFAESGTEIIDDLCVNKNGTEIVYAQNSFSVIGAIAVTIGND